MNYQLEFNHLLQKHKCSLNLQVGDFCLEALLKGTDKNDIILFLTGNSSMKQNGLFEKYRSLLISQGNKVITYDGLNKATELNDLEQICALARTEKVNLILSLGGGAVIDAGKAVSVGYFNRIENILRDPSVIKNRIPHIACATTSGTGSHLTPFAVINNSKTLEKRTLKHELLLPEHSLVETTALRFLKADTIAETGFDALCHAMEVYTRLDSPLAAQEFAFTALRLIGKHLLLAFRSSSSDDLLGMAFADSFSGVALSFSGTHLAHAISHPISFRFPEISHGLALSMVTIPSIKFQLRHGGAEIKKRYQDIAQVLSGQSDILLAIEKLSESLGLNRKSLNMDANDVQTIYQDTVRYRWESALRCPVDINQSDLKNIIFQSLI